MKTYKFNQTQKDWIKYIYPYCEKDWRNILRPIYFSTHYTSHQKDQLNSLGMIVKTAPEEFVELLIPLKDYLG